MPFDTFVETQYGVVIVLPDVLQVQRNRCSRPFTVQVKVRTREVKVNAKDARAMEGRRKWSMLGASVGEQVSPEQQKSEQTLDGGCVLRNLVKFSYLKDSTY